MTALFLFFLFLFWGGFHLTFGGQFPGLGVHVATNVSQSTKQLNRAGQEIWYVW